MKKDVDIIVVLDRSGSMQSIKNETISGFNSFVSEQKKLDYRSSLTLVQFDDRYQIDYESVDINKVPELNTDTFVPRGLTALLDAIGKTIKTTRDRYSKLVKNDLPDKTIFVIITDGQENNSTKYNRKRIFKKIRKMEKEQNWEFVFLGANQDAISEANNYGINAKRAMTYAADKVGTTDMFFSLSANIEESLENGGEFEFTNEQRDKQKR